MLKPFILIVCFWSIFINITIKAQNTVIYYVSDSGNNLNSGTIDSPFATIQQCIDKWDGINQFICNCQGTFNEELVVDQSGPSALLRNKIIAWDTDLDGSLADEVFILDGENTRNIGLTNKLSPYSKPDNIEVAYLQFKNFFPDGGCVSGGDNLASFIDISCTGGGPAGGCTDWWIHHCTFENIGYKSDTDRCHAESHYIALKPTNAARLTIEKNTFTGIYAFLMRYMDGPDIKFINNNVTIGTTGIKGWGENLDRLIISGNTFYCDGNGNPDNSSTASCLGQNAINISNNARESLISNNTFYDCVECVKLGTEEAYGTRNNENNIIENNIIHRTEKVCNKFVAPITIDDCTNASIINGVNMVVKNITIRNNIINYHGVHTLSSQWNAGAGIELISGHPVDFENNYSIYNNSIKGFYWGVRLSPCRIGSAYPPYQLNGVNIQNNIFSDIRDAQFTLNTAGVWAGTQTLPRNFSSNFNSFHGRDRFKWVSNRTLAQWKSVYSYDLNSNNCKPIFADTLTLELSLSDNCAIDKGASIEGFNIDLEGNSRPSGLAWDLGAYEFQASPLPVRLISFIGKAESMHNQLIWTVSNEQNFSHYEIEKSVDIQHFKKIGTVKRKESDSEISIYEYPDNEIINNSIEENSLNNVQYYRLKMIDAEDNHAYSNIVALKSVIDDEEIGYFYPNPTVGNKVSINIYSAENANWQIKSFNPMGRPILNETRKLKKGFNKVELSIETQILEPILFHFSSKTKSFYRKLILSQ